MNNVLTVTDRAAMPGILAAVLAEPGITNAELSSRLNHPTYRVRKVLANLRKSGEVALVHGGREDPPRWYPPAEAMKVQAERERDAAIKRRERNRVYSGKHYARLKAAEDEDDEDGAPIRIHKPAGAWERPAARHMARATPFDCLVAT